MWSTSQPGTEHNVRTPLVIRVILQSKHNHEDGSGPHQSLKLSMLVCVMGHKFTRGIPRSLTVKDINTIQEVKL